MGVQPEDREMPEVTGGRQLLGDQARRKEYWQERSYTGDRNGDFGAGLPAVGGRGQWPVQMSSGGRKQACRQG
jgi:hypothetical protein